MPIKKGSPRVTPRGFTLIEILVVIAVLVVLAAIVMLILNPAEYLRRARDAQRLSDATHINLAMALFNYGASSNSVTEDGDGPRFPTTDPTPGVHDSCKTDRLPAQGGVDHRIFVSVPSDSGQPTPTPIADWQYSQVTSDKLRAVDGSGWLPINLTQVNGSQPPLAVLPVDPVNTFASGYYYSYGCGSWDLNMRFESAKYQDLMTTDGGSFSNVYEVGNDLTLLPVQPAYAIGNSTNATKELYPNSDPAGWIGTYNSINEASSTLSATVDSTFIYSAGTVNSFSASSTFLMSAANGSIPEGAIIDNVRVVVRADQFTLSTFSIKLRFKNASGFVDKSINGLAGNLSTNFTQYTTDFPLNPITVANWQPLDFANLEIGPVIISAGTGRAQVSQIYAIVSYH